MFRDKTVIIIGVGKNIGKAIAEEFFSEHANVVANSILPKEKSEIKKELFLSNHFFYSQGDITSLEYQTQLIQETLNRFSKIDILINNVGIGSGKGFFDLSPQIMEKSLKTNLLAPFLFSQKVAKKMIEKKIQGCIICLSSIHAKIPSGNPDYSATKSALETIVKEIAFELGPSGIRVNAVAPGKITPKSVPDRRIPLLKKSGLPLDIAKAVLFLANNSTARYITGEVLTVDGGLSLASER